MTTLDAATRQSLRHALYAYLHNFGGESQAEIRAIAGSLLSVQEKAGELAPQGLQIEQWVDELVADFDPTEMATQVWDEAGQLLATQAKHWRETLEIKTRATLDAYLQQYMPEMDRATLQAIAATVLPLVEAATITRDEARRLIAVVSEVVNEPTALHLHRVLDPKWVLLAEKVHQVQQYREVEASTTEVVSAYVHKFQPAAIEISEGLVEQAMQAVTNSKVKLKLGLDVGLDAPTRKLLVKQVMLKFKLMEASSQPAKTALEVAQQVHDEVLHYRQKHGLAVARYLPPVTTTDHPTGNSILGGEMSVGIDLHPRTSTANASDSDEEPAETD